MKKLSRMAIFFTSICVISSYCTNANALTERQTFQVSFRIPEVDFHVLPVDPYLLTQQQELEWDVSRRSLRPLVANFDVRSTAGAVNAYLEASPVMRSDRSIFGLSVRFNGQTLRSLETGAVEVLNQQEASAGKRVALEIIPGPPLGGYVPGIYYGNVRIIFDVVIEAGR